MLSLKIAAGHGTVKRWFGQGYSIVFGKQVNCKQIF
jgi:hypothetical protein